MTEPPDTGGSDVHDVLKHHTAETRGFEPLVPVRELHLSRVVGPIVADVVPACPLGRRSPGIRGNMRISGHSTPSLADLATLAMHSEIAALGMLRTLLGHPEMAYARR